MGAEGHPAEHGKGEGEGYMGERGWRGGNTVGGGGEERGLEGKGRREDLRGRGGERT